MRFCLTFFVAGIIGSFPAICAQAQNRDAPQLYAQFCSGCHGENLAGGKGSSLIAGHWKHGSDDASLLRNIREGNPLSGMPPFASALSEPEMRALIVYIREVGTRATNPQPTAAEPLPGTIQQSEAHAYRFES